MQTLKRFIVSSIVALVVTGTAHAVMLITPPLVPLGDVNFECQIINVSTAPLSVRMQVWGGSNNLISDSGVFTLNPGMSGGTGAVTNDLPRYCKFIVGGTKQAVRASAYLVDPSVGSISVVAAE